MATLTDIESRIDTMFGTGDDDTTDTATTTTTTENADGGSSTTEGGGEASTTEGAAKQAAAPAGSQQPAASTGGEQQPATQPVDGRQGAQPQTPPSGRLPANNNGDLVDRNGQVVAKAGNERRFYEAARNAQVDATRLRADNERVSTELKAFRDAAVLPQQLGLVPVEVANAMQFMAHFKSDPLGAAKKVFAELQAMGHNLEGITGSVDMAAIKQMVNDAVSPFVADRSTVQRQQEIATAVDTEIAQVFNQFDWAQHQEEALQDVLRADPNLSLRDAAMLTENFALRNRYDLTKPLRAQHLAATSGQPQQQQVQQPVHQQHNNAAMQPAPAATASDAVVPRRTTAVNTDRSLKDIVRESMREAGLRVDNF